MYQPPRLQFAPTTLRDPDFHDVRFQRTFRPQDERRKAEKNQEIDGDFRDRVV